MSWAWLECLGVMWFAPSLVHWIYSTREPEWDGHPSQAINAQSHVSMSGYMLFVQRVILIWDMIIVSCNFIIISIN